MAKKELNVKIADKMLSGAFIRAASAAGLAAILLIYEILSLFNKETGLIDVTTVFWAINAVVILLLFYIVGVIFFVTSEITRMAGFVSLQASLPIAISIAFGGVCFFFQSIFDLLNVLKAPDFISASLCVLGFLSAVSYGAEGLSMITGRFGVPHALRLFPMLWGGVYLLRVTMTFPKTVSMQGDFSKVLCCVFTVVFLTYSARWLCGLEKRFDSGIGVFFRLVFPFIGVVMGLPYAIVMLFSIKDAVWNMPYLAIFGLIPFGTTTLLQYMAQALYNIEKRIKKAAATAALKAALNADLRNNKENSGGEQ